MLRFVLHYLSNAVGEIMSGTGTSITTARFEAR